MNNILVSLSVPKLNEKYDLFVPDDLQIDQLTKLIAQGVFDVSGGVYKITNNELLIKLTTEELLNPKRKLVDYACLDGETLILL